MWLSWLSRVMGRWVLSDAFGPTGEGHLRMSFCVPADTIHKAFDRLEEFFGIGTS